MTQIPQPVIDWFNSKVFDFALTVIALLGAGWLLWKFAKSVWPSLKNAVTFFSALGQLPAFMSSTSQTLAEVHHEIFPTGGGSMRDDMRIMELRVQKVEEHDAADQLRMKAIENELAYRVAARDRARSGQLPAFPVDTSEDRDGTN